MSGLSTTTNTTTSKSRNNLSVLVAEMIYSKAEQRSKKNKKKETRKQTYHRSKLNIKEIAEDPEAVRDALEWRDVSLTLEHLSAVYITLCPLVIISSPITYLWVQYDSCTGR